MTRIIAIGALVIFSTALLVGQAKTAPKPSPVPVQWEIDIDVQKPKALRVRATGESPARVFWYMVYTVTNNTPKDQVFVPEFTLYTDTGQILRAGQQVPTTVFDAIKNTANDPLLRDTIGVAGKLLQGTDNAKTGVAIWPDFDPQAGAFDVFIGGLSGETTEIKLPEPIDVRQRDAKGEIKTVTKDKMILSKTLHLRYSILGEAAARLGVTPSLVSKDWIMR